MKKVYNKPVILIEDFGLSEMIAAGTDGCGIKTTMWDQVNCQSDNAGMQDWWSMGLFLENTTCQNVVTQEGYDKVCEFTAASMFNS